MIQSITIDYNSNCAVINFSGVSSCVRLIKAYVTSVSAFTYCVSAVSLSVVTHRTWAR